MLGKYIGLLINDTRLVRHEFGDERFEKISQIKWFPITLDLRTDNVLTIQRTLSDFHDSPINMANLNIESEHGFEIDQKKASRQLVYDNLFHNSVTIEISLDQEYTYRKVHGIFDFLAELGGVFGAISSLCIILVSLL